MPPELTVAGPVPAARADAFRTIYSNGVKIQATPWDLRMIFGHVHEVGDGRTINEEQVEVVMSPQHAKALLAHWARTLKEYEQTFGEVVDPSPKLDALRNELQARSNEKK